MNDERTHLGGVPILGRSAEDVEQESGRTARPAEGNTGGVVVPRAYSATGGGGVGVPATGAPFAPTATPGRNDRRA